MNDEQWTALYRTLAHGDDEHRAWLRGMIQGWASRHEGREVWVSKSQPCVVFGPGEVKSNGNLMDNLRKETTFGADLPTCPRCQAKRLLPRLGVQRLDAKTVQCLDCGRFGHPEGKSGWVWGEDKPTPAGDAANPTYDHRGER